MAFAVTHESMTVAGLNQALEVIRLGETDGAASATIAPEFGFNVFQWSARGVGELLYADPQIFPGGRPTRSGIPVLFPYPNRIRSGRFTFGGKKYQLPLTDSSGAHSIHGFACRRPWRILAEGADDSSAWVRAEFQASVDFPEMLSAWPADHRLTLTVRLSGRSLRIEAKVGNPDNKPLPFGLGFHPYFLLASPDEKVQAFASEYWELQDSLPTGKIWPVDLARNLETPRAASSLQLDDVLTCLRQARRTDDGLILRGRVGSMELRTSADFRELVAFTPPHRRAICLEPYTCTTDAANLHGLGLDTGWKTLAPGQVWSGIIEMAIAS